VNNSDRTRRCTRPPTASAFARASLQPSLPAAGELGRCAAAPTWIHGIKVLWSLIRGGLKRYLVASSTRSLILTGSGAAFWAAGGAAFRLVQYSSTTRRCTRPLAASDVSATAGTRGGKRRVSLVVVPPRLRDTNRVWSTPVAGTCPPSMRVLASAFLWLMRFCSGAALWVSGGAAFWLGCGFWLPAVKVFRLCSKYFGRAASGGQNIPTAAQQGAAPDRLQPALVPRFGFRRRVSLVVVPRACLAARTKLGLACCSGASFGLLPLMLFSSTPKFLVGSGRSRSARAGRSTTRRCIRPPAASAISSVSARFLSCCGWAGGG